MLARLGVSTLWLATILLAGPGVVLAQYQFAGPELDLTTDGSDSHIAPLPDGGFQRVWATTTSIVTQRYDAANNAGPEITFGSGGGPTGAVIGVAPDGSSVVAWRVGTSMRAQRLDATGLPEGAEFDVASANGLPTAVAHTSTGEFVVTYQEFSSYPDVGARHFDANANPTGAAFVVNEYTTGTQLDSKVIVMPNDEFVVVWRNASGGGPSGVSARRIASDGTPLGTQFQLAAAGSPFMSVAAVAGGEFVVAWHANPYTADALQMNPRPIGRLAASECGGVSKLRSSTSAALPRSP